MEQASKDYRVLYVIPRLLLLFDEINYQKKLEHLCLSQQLWIKLAKSIDSDTTHLSAWSKRKFKRTEYVHHI